MSDNEIFETLPQETDSVVNEHTETPKEKKEKKKRVISEERRLVVLEQLKRGRETARANRQKTALVKRLEKQKHQEKADQVIREGVGRDDSTNENYKRLESQIANLTKLMAEKKNSDVGMMIEKVKVQKAPELPEVYVPPPPPKPVERPPEKPAPRVTPPMKIEKPKVEEPYVPKRFSFKETVSSVADDEEELDLSTFKSFWT
jgi:hypothetical protein